MSAFDDYMSAPVAAPQQGFDAYLGAAQVPAPAAGGTGAAAPQTAAGQNVNPSPIPPSGGGSSQGIAQPGTLASGLIGFGKGLGNVVAGTEELLGKGASAVGLNTVGNYLSNDANWQRGQINSGSAAAEAAHPFATGVGNVAGNMFGTAPAMLIGPAYAGLAAAPGATLGARAALLAARTGVGALQGAAGAAMMPVDDPNNNFWTQKAEQTGVGGLLGGAVPLVAAGANAAGRGLWNAVQPVVQPGRFVGQGLAGAMDPAEAAAAAANIRNAPQFVPGSIPTTAQAAQTPVMVQTEKAAANDITPFKTALMNRASDNNNARWQALMGVAQDQPALDAATQARAAAAQPLYDAAHQATANVGPAFMKYAQIPEMQEAMQRAHDTASLDAAVGRGIPPVWPSPAVPGGAPASKAINGSALDYTSRALGDMINEAQRQGATTRAGSLTALKNNVDSWMGQYIPGVQQARAAYAAGSVPINTMEAGQQIANKLGTKSMMPGVGGGVAELQLNPYSTALQQAMKAQPFGIDAGAHQTLQGIGQDLQRQSLSNSVKTGGSDTAYNLGANGWLAKQLYGPTFGGATGIGRAIAGIGTAMAGHPWAGLAAAGGIGKVGQAVGNRLQSRLSGLLMNPDTVLPYLDARAAAAAQPVQGPLMQGLLNYGRPAAVQGLLGGFNNAGNK